MSWSAIRQHACERMPSIDWPLEAPAGWVLHTGVPEDRWLELALFACAQSTAGAMKEVLKRLEVALKGWMQRTNYPPSLRDDAVQVASATLLSPQSKYLGTGPLDHWLTVASVRIALNLLRSERRSLANEALPEGSQSGWGALVSSTPEFRVLKQNQLVHFKAAFEAAVATLSARDRGLVALRYAQGVDVDCLARMYGVHRVTMSRWLTGARDDLSRALFDLLGTSSAESSLRHWLGSAPDLSLSRLFAATS